MIDMKLEENKKGLMEIVKTNKGWIRGEMALCTMDIQCRYCFFRYLKASEPHGCIKEANRLFNLLSIEEQFELLVEI